jgi:hypothetical protein
MAEGDKEPVGKTRKKHASVRQATAGLTYEDSCQSGARARL